MFGKKYTSLVDNYVIDNPAEDAKLGDRIGKYKLSNQAIYNPDGSYLPFAAVTEAMRDRGTVHVTGCCGNSAYVERVIARVDGKPFVFLFDTVEEAKRVLERIV